MKHAVRITLALCVITAAAFAQGEQLKVAVYMSGKNQTDAKSQIVGIALTDALSKHANFIVTERTKDFMSTIEKENMYQHSGAVDDSQIAELGKKSGVSYVCVSEVVSFSQVFPGSKEYLLTARFLNVESATIVASAYRIAVLEGGPATLKASQRLAKTLITEFEKRDEGTQRERIAIYLADEGGGRVDRGVGRVLQPLFIHSVIKSGRYTVTERTGSFLESLSQELGHQYSGAVDDNQLVKLGAQSGVKYIMTLKAISEIANIRLIDVTTGDIQKSTIGSVDISSIGGIEASVANLIAKFLGAGAKTSLSSRVASGGVGTRSGARAEKGNGVSLGYVNVGAVSFGDIDATSWDCIYNGRCDEYNGAADAFSIGFANVSPISNNVSFAAQGNFWIGSYNGSRRISNTQSEKIDFAVYGLNVPLVFQFTVTPWNNVMLFAEGGFGLDLLMNFTQEFYLFDGNLIVGGGMAFDVGGGVRIFADPVGLSFGINHFSYKPSVRIVFY